MKDMHYSACAIFVHLLSAGADRVPLGWRRGAQLDWWKSRVHNGPPLVGVKAPSCTVRSQSTTIWDVRRGRSARLSDGLKGWQG